MSKNGQEETKKIIKREKERENKESEREKQRERERERGRVAMEESFLVLFFSS